jgi:type II secretory pathway component PulJ
VSSARSHGIGVAGFTIVELIVTTAISLVLGSAGFFFFRDQVRSLIDQAAGLDAIEGARAALDFMGNDIRMASLDPTGDCANCDTAGLSNARSDTITVAWDVDGNDTLDAAEFITYAYNSGAKTVTRTINGTTTTLIRNVPSGGLSFQYLQSDGSAAAMLGSPATVTTPANVTTVLVTVQVEAKKATNPWNTTVASRVTLRNRDSALARL